MKDLDSTVALEKEFLTPDEACRLLGCSRRSLEYWKQAQALPFVKIGRFVRINREALLTWFRSFTVNKRDGGENDA